MGELTCCIRDYACVQGRAHACDLAGMRVMVFACGLSMVLSARAWYICGGVKRRVAGCIGGCAAEKRGGIVVLTWRDTQEKREQHELRLFFNRKHEEEAAKRSTARRVLNNLPTSTRTKIIVDSHKAQVMSSALPSWCMRHGFGVLLCVCGVLIVWGATNSDEVVVTRRGAKGED